MEIKAKFVSLFGKISLAIGALIIYILYWKGFFPEASDTSIGLAFGVIYAILCGTIDTNLIIKNAKKKNEETA